MFFHPEDGFLYLSLGDEGGDYGNTQRIDKDLFSGVIRIDVDCRGGSVSHPPTADARDGADRPLFHPRTITRGSACPGPWRSSGASASGARTG